MRPAFRIAGALLVLTLLLAYYGLGTVAAESPGAIARSAGSSSCSSTFTLYAYDSLSWSSSQVGPLCAKTTFTVINTGSTQHTFTVSDLVNQSDSSTTSTSFFTASASDTFYQASQTTWLNGSATLTITITFPTAGSYQFTCIPHYALGMDGFLYVDEPLPAPPAGAPSFAPFWYIVAVVATLAVLSVVLGMVYGKRGAEEEFIGDDAPVTARPDYYNDSRPEPMDAAEPMKRGKSPPTS